MTAFGIAREFADGGSAVRPVDGRDHFDLGAQGSPFAVVSGMVSVFAAARREDGTPGRRCRTMVSGPGHSRSASSSQRGHQSSTSARAPAPSRTCAISGLFAGRHFIR